jgi:hypothetical protein
VNKAQSQRRHAKRRAVERYALDLNRKDLARIVADIQHGRARFLGRQSNRVSLFGVSLSIHGVMREVPVVYDRERKQVVTLLPLNELVSTVETPALDADPSETP